MIAEDRERVFGKAKREPSAFFESKGLAGVDIRLSDQPPQADRTSGKSKHIYREFD